MTIIPGFYITKKDAQVSEIIEELYADNSALYELFYRCNTSLHPHQLLREGELFYAPHEACLKSITELQKSIALIHYHQQQMTSQELLTFNTFHNLIAYIDSETIRTVVGDLAEGYLAKARAHKNFVESILIKIEDLYRTSLIQHGYLSNSFYHQRAELFSQLELGLNQWIRNILIPDANVHSSLKKQFNLSSKSILHKWYRDGHRRNIKQFTEHYLRLQQLGIHLARGGHILTGLDIGFASYNILNACTHGIDKGCLRSGFVETAQLGGSMIGAQAGFNISMKQCSASFFIPIPGSTSVSCTLGVGIVTATASEIGSYIAGSLAGKIFDYSYSLLTRE